MKTVLGVGNCSIDHAAISRVVRRHFDASVVSAARLEEALSMLRNRPVDLVLVNRRLHGDPLGGLEAVRKFKADPDLSKVPVMLLSDMPDQQEAAVAEGAEPGFGKSELSSPKTVKTLGRFLT